MQVGILGAEFLYAIVSGLKASQQPGPGIARDRVGIHLLDSFGCDPAGFLPAFISAHAVGHDGQAAFQRKGLIVIRLPIGVTVFIVFSLAANITEAPELNSRPNFHSTSLQKDYTWANWGLYRTKCQRRTKVGT